MATETAIEKASPRSIEVANHDRRASGWTYRPGVDIFDTSEAVLLIADLPGADASSIDVSLEAGVLTIQADVPPRQHDAAFSVSHEYGIGGFHRRFEIDDSVDPDGVTAEYRNGVLTVRLPKSQQSRRRRIPIQS